MIALVQLCFDMARKCNSGYSIADDYQGIGKFKEFMRHYHGKVYMDVICALY